MSLLEKLHPLIQAGDTFLFEAPINTSKGPHIRDAIDVKRWMMIVVFALLPALLFGIWNTGVQTFVYSSGDYKLMNEYLAGPYLDFSLKHFNTILWLGLKAVVPLIVISYAVGGLCEAIFACIRGHEISEGFLVTGILYALILPSTIPYWMAAVGVAFGTILGKEVFGGSGMNIVNPAMICRCFLFFTFPGRMSGDVWAGINPTVVRESLLKMNQEAQTSALDGFSQATHLARFNVTSDIKRIHIDAIASNTLGSVVGTWETLQKYFAKWNVLGQHDSTLGQLTPDQLRHFVTSPALEGGLGLSPGSFEDAYHLSSLTYGLGHNHDWGFFFGDKLGSIGETSVFACLLGALFLIWTGVGSWRTMMGMGLGAFITALLFEWGSKTLGAEEGAWNPAAFSLPAYKHLLLGGLAFGLVFMATDPVSSPGMNGAKWIYGALCGFVTILIRVVNPAYPEGVMLAIIMGNCFAPLIDYYTLAYSRPKRRVARVPAKA